MYRKSIGRDRAIALFEGNWWVGRPAREIAKFQLFTSELCLPFEVFRRALEATLGRPVWLHEFGLDPDGLAHEFLGERDPPSMQDILDLLPRDERQNLLVAELD